MDGLGFLVAAVAFVMVLVAFRRISRLETRLNEFGSALKEERGRSPVVAAEPGAPASPEVIAVDDRGVPIYSAAAPGEQAPAAVLSANWTGSETAPREKAPDDSGTRPGEQAEAAPAATAPAPRQPEKPDMEQALASRWFVWIGGVAIAIGGLLFVKYAYDNGLISPVLQIILGLVAGLALVGAGEAVRRKAMPQAGQPASYAPAALSASGLAILFAAIYAAYALYELVDPTAAFLGLAAVGIGSLGLSRWQGPLIAALGLLGSYVPPALIPSEHPQAWSFFPYLLVILAASFLVLRARPWWWLGHAAVAGAFVWAMLWLLGPFQPADVWPLGLFAHLVGLVAVFGLSGSPLEDGAALPAWNIGHRLAVSLVGLLAELVLLIVLAVTMHHAGTALLLLAAAAAFLLALAWTRPVLSALAPLAALVMFGVLASWSEAAFHALTLDEYGVWTWSSAIGPEAERYLRWMLGCGAAFAAAGILGTLAHASPRMWGATAAGAAFAFLWGAWARTDFLLAPSAWSAIAAVFAAALLSGTAASNRRAEDPAANLAGGLLAAAAAALLVFALDRLLDGLWFTLWVAVLALGFAMLSGPLKARLLGPVTAALASLTTLRLFLSRELWLDDRSLPLGQHWMLYGYGAPALLFYAASRVLRRTGHPRSAVALEGISLGLLIALVSLEIRVLISGNAIYENPQFLEMAAHILTWSGAAYGLMHRQRLYSSLISLWGARLLLALSALSVVLFSLVLLNPVVTGEPVPGNTVFNALLLAYLAPLVLIGLIAQRLDVIGWGGLRPVAAVLALVLAFAYLTLETKLVFQGRIMLPWSLSVAESYAFSAVWLSFALALFVAGIRLAKQHVRLAGLAVMALVVLKVFLWDMSNLGGLYRIASFVGLGLCLVGIGWLYQRFVHRPGAVDA